MKKFLVPALLLLFLQSSLSCLSQTNTAADDSKDSPQIMPDKGSTLKGTLAVYPNPLSTSATIKFNSIIDDAEVNICDRQGKVIFKIDNVSGDKIKIYRRELPAGIYIIRVVKDDETLMTGRLIVQD